jgi:general secretion pathway protein G
MMTIARSIATIAFVVTTSCDRGAHPLSDVREKLTKAQQNQARTDLDTLRDAVLFYKMNHNALPPTLDVLVEPDPKNADAPYIESESIPFDPWEKPYRFEVNDKGFRIYSLGADGAEGGEGEAADIEVAR